MDGIESLVGNASSDSSAKERRAVIAAGASIRTVLDPLSRLPDWAAVADLGTATEETWLQCGSLEVYALRLPQIALGFLPRLNLSRKCGFDVKITLFYPKSLILPV